MGVGRGSLRQLLSILLVVILCATSTYAAKPSASIPAQVAQKPTLQEKVLDIPPGSRLQVRLKNNEKLRGWLGEVSNEGFVLQYARGNQIEKRIIGFDEVKSIKVKSIKVKAGGRAWRVAKWILMAGGIYIVVLIISCRAGKCL